MNSTIFLELDNLKNAMLLDIKGLNEHHVGANLGAKGKEVFDPCKLDGEFVHIESCPAYVYTHNRHTSFSNAKYSSWWDCLQKEGSRGYVDDTDCFPDHHHHDKLHRFFRCNFCLERYIDKDRGVGTIFSLGGLQLDFHGVLLHPKH